MHEESLHRQRSCEDGLRAVAWRHQRARRCVERLRHCLRRSPEAYWQDRGPQVGRPGQDCFLQGARPVRPGLVLHSCRCARALLATPPGPSRTRLLRLPSHHQSARASPPITPPSTRLLTLPLPSPRCAAAIARRIYLRGGTGVGALKKVFGGRKMRGTRHEIFSKGSGSIARHALKQLELLKIIEKVPDGKGCVQLPPLPLAPPPHGASSGIRVTRLLPVSRWRRSRDDSLADVAAFWRQRRRHTLNGQPPSQITAPDSPLSHHAPRSLPQAEDHCAGPA